MHKEIGGRDRVSHILKRARIRSSAESESILKFIVYFSPRSVAIFIVMVKTVM